MSINPQRRRLLKWLATGIGASSIQALAGPTVPAASRSYAVVVIGGGFAGATFARTLRRLDANVGITLVEPCHQYHCCPMGVEYLVGKRDEETLVFGYEQLRAEGIEVVQSFSMTNQGTLNRLAQLLHPCTFLSALPTMSLLWMR